MFVDMHDEQQSESQQDFVLSVLGTSTAETAVTVTTTKLGETSVSKAIQQPRHPCFVFCTLSWDVSTQSLALLFHPLGPCLGLGGDNDLTCLSCQLLPYLLIMKLLSSLSAFRDLTSCVSNSPEVKSSDSGLPGWTAKRLCITVVSKPMNHTLQCPCDLCRQFTSAVASLALRPH